MNYILNLHLKLMSSMEAFVENPITYRNNRVNMKDFSRNITLDQIAILQSNPKSSYDQIKIVYRLCYYSLTAMLELVLIVKYIWHAEADHKYRSIFMHL